MDAQAWEKVDELIDKNQTKTIKDLFAEDKDRVRAEFGFIFGAVEFDHRLIDEEGVASIEAN